VVILLGLLNATLAGVPNPVQIADSLVLEGSAEAQAALQEVWQSARLTLAAAGTPERVRIPVTFRSQGWGCPCPDVFVGTSTNIFTTGPWLSLTYAEGLAPPEPPREGLVVVAEGHFTGKRSTLDLQPTGEQIPDYVYALQGFEVSAWRTWREGGQDDWLVVLPAVSSD